MAGEVLARVRRAERYPTGLMHFVFEATNDRGQSVVVRASRREDVGVAQNSIYWSERLRPLGVPMPELLHADVTMERHRFPFIVLQRLPGRDLKFVVDDLSPTEMHRLAARLVEVQAAVTGLGNGRGFGFTPRMEGPYPHGNWRGCVDGALARSRKRIGKAGMVSEHYVDMVEAAAANLDHYFDHVQATPFLHDITTKNVLIDEGQLTGIVDVDDLCFGDPLFLLALIRVALLGNGHRSDYIDIWLDILRLDDEQTAALNFYTASFCLDFLSEIGHSFNRDQPVPAETERVERLQDLLVRHLAA